MKKPCDSCGAKAGEECRTIGSPPKEAVPSATEMPPRLAITPWSMNKISAKHRVVAYPVSQSESEASLRDTIFISKIEHTALLADAIKLARKDAFEEAAEMIRKFPRATQDTIIASLEAKAEKEKT